MCMPFHHLLMYVVKNVFQASLPSFLLAIFYLNQCQVEIACSAQRLCRLQEITNWCMNFEWWKLSIELHLNATFAQDILHWNQFMKKAFFELAQGVWDSKLNYLNCSHERLVQKEALTICQNRVFGSFLCVLSLSSVLESQHLTSQWAIQEKSKQVDSRISVSENTPRNL